MKPVFIYALTCPATGAIRYIGKTSNPEKRLREHVRDSKKERGHRANWIRSLISHGQTPKIEMLAQVPESEWPQWEIDYIMVFRSLGCNLVNDTAGGETPPSWLGRRHTPSVIAKISATKKAANRTGSRNPLFGRKQPLETVAKHIGKKHTAATIKKMRLSHTGKIYSSESRIKMKVAKLGKKQSPEHVAKRVAARKLSQEKKNLWPTN